MRTTGGTNWNVIGLTDPGGHLVERYVLSPYGELTVYQETGYGDYDEDYDVMGDPPSTSDPDYTAFTGACAGSGPTGACRILDLDFDGDVDTTDPDNYFMSLPHGVMRHPGRIATAVHQPFTHQVLLFGPEITSYQNWARQYNPVERRFLQRDPLIFLRYNSNTTDQYVDGLSLYQYVQGSPINKVDSAGLDSCICFPGEGFTIVPPNLCPEQTRKVDCATECCTVKQNSSDKTITIACTWGKKP